MLKLIYLSIQLSCLNFVSLFKFLELILDNQNHLITHDQNYCFHHSLL